MSKAITLIFLFCNNFIYSQSLTGTWNGNFYKTNFTEKPINILFDFDILNDTLLIGSTHLVYKKNHFEHYSIIGTKSKNDSTIYFKEIKTIGLNLGKFESNCKGNYKVKLVRNDSITRYEGVWKDNSTALFKCPTSGVFFERKNKITTQNLKIVSKPKDSILHVLEIEKSRQDSISFEVFDDAVIDNDIISIYLNNELKFENIRLSDKSIIRKLSLDKNLIVNKIQIVAVSEGEFSPCTGIIKIFVANKKYIINMRSSKLSNGIIDLILY